MSIKSEEEDKIRAVVKAVALLQDHESDGLGECGCSHCCYGRELINQHPKIIDLIFPLIKG